MKLTNQQLSALALKISREINDANNVFNEKYLKEQEAKIKAELTHNFILLQALTKDVAFDHSILVKDVKGRLYSSLKDIENLSSNSLKYIVTTEEGSLYRNNVYADTIKDDLLIATIECDNFDALVSSIKAKYEITH